MHSSAMTEGSSKAVEVGSQESVEEDLRWCHVAVQDVSRTFALTVSELEPPMTDYICVGYLICRIADTVEDATHIPPADKGRLLATYRETIEPEGETTAEQFREAAEPWVPEDPDADWRLVREAPKVLRTFRTFDEASRAAMRPSILEMIDGMALFIDRYAAEGGIRIETLPELEDYSWYVAGTVGFLVTELLAPAATDDQADTMRETAEAYAHLLQFVNIAKDAKGDYLTENNVYVPNALLEENGLEVADLGDPKRATDFAPVLRTLVDRAEEFSERAQAWIGAMPEARGTTRAAFAVPFLLAIATIRELKSRPQDVIAKGGVKVEREEVIEILSRFHSGEPSIEGLRRMIRQQPLHEA